MTAGAITYIVHTLKKQKQSPVEAYTPLRWQF